MFKLNEKYEIKRNILKCDYIRYSPPKISTINTANSQIFITISREDSVISLLNSYIVLIFDVLHAATNNRYIDGKDIRFVNLGPIALISSCNLTTSSGKRIEEVNHAHILSFLYKLITSARGCDDLSIGFDRDRDRRRLELTKNKNLKAEGHVRIYLKVMFGFAEHQEKGTYGLGYKLTSTGNIDNAVLKKDNTSNDGKIKINGIQWYVPHYIPSIAQQAILIKQIQSRTPTKPQYPKKSGFKKEVNTQKIWRLELGTQGGMNVPTWIYVVFQQSDRQHDQNLNNDTFHRTPVTSAQVVIGTEKYPDSGILLNYNDDDYVQGYCQIKEAFKARTKDNVLQPYISENDFRSSNDGDDVGRNIYVFDK